MKMKLQLDNCTVEYDDSQEVKDAVFQRVLAFAKKEEIFTGESLNQMDSGTIGSLEAMTYILDDIIKFKVNYDE